MTITQKLIKKGYLRKDTDKVIYPAKWIEHLLKSKDKFEITFLFDKAPLDSKTQSSPST